MADGFFKQIQDNWKALAVIAGIMGAGIGGYIGLMAHVAEAAEVQTKAIINKEMVDGAKKAAADAVKEQLPTIAQEVAKQVAQEVVKAQKEEAKKVGKK